MRIALIVLVAGCLRSNLVNCADGFLCPPGRICTPDDMCVLQGQIDACAGRRDGEDCAEMPGMCSNGYCAQSTIFVTLKGTGQGSVTSDPPGIQCGPTCSSMFEDIVDVTLTASPAAGSTFAGWGGRCSGTADCVLKVTLAGAAVDATFMAVAN